MVPAHPTPTHYHHEMKPSLLLLVPLIFTSCATPGKAEGNRHYHTISWSIPF
jgi:hypothetical protein